MHDRSQLERVGQSAAVVLRREATWIHRRVETLDFPLPDTPTVRRRISIDFSIPADLEPIDPGTSQRPSRFYVPLSILRKWPPLDRLDLFGEDGRSIPFLTGLQNRELDAIVLAQMAAHLAGAEGLSEDEMRQIEGIALSRDAGRDALEEICPPFDIRAKGTLSKALDVLREDPIFIRLARTLCEQTILWLRTEGDVHDREIVKFAYDLPWDGNPKSLDSTSFGLAPFVFEFATPHAGATGSYHLHLETPPQLKAIAAELVLFENASDVREGQDIPKESIRYQVTPGRPASAPYGDFEAHADVHGPTAKFYLTGDRTELAGRAYVKVKVDVDGFLRGASLGCLLIALIIGAFAWKHKQVMSNSDAAVAALLVVPALLAFLLRPSEHVLVGSLIGGLRRIAVLVGVWPLVASVLVVTISDAGVLRSLSSGLRRWRLRRAQRLQHPFSLANHGLASASRPSTHARASSSRPPHGTRCDQVVRRARRRRGTPPPTQPLTRASSAETSRAGVATAAWAKLGSAQTRRRWRRRRLVLADAACGWRVRRLGRPWRTRRERPFRWPRASSRSRGGRPGKAASRFRRPRQAPRG